MSAIKFLIWILGSLLSCAVAFLVYLVGGFGVSTEFPESGTANIASILWPAFVIGALVLSITGWWHMMTRTRSLFGSTVMFSVLGLIIIAVLNYFVYNP